MITIPTCVIEKERTRRILCQWLNRLGITIINSSDELRTRTGTDNYYLLMEEFSLEMARLLSEGTGLNLNLANVYKERNAENTDFYAPLSELTESDFNRIYASRMRGPDQQMRHEDGSDYSQSSSMTGHIQRE
jgi:hypothetical protein